MRMGINPELNKVLKAMWRLDEQGCASQDEKDFFEKHLPAIQAYYTNNAEYWNKK
jgi:hypothetical protein